MKIAIIGAGICGLYLAWKLAERGEEVTVFEKREKIGKEVCSGLFSERILDFIPESKKLIQNQIKYCLIHWVAGGWRPKRTLQIKFSRKFLVMNHYELDNLIANLAEKSGAKIFLNYNITRSVLATLKNDFERIIGCDGANSIIRKSLGLPEPNFRLGIQGFTACPVPSERSEDWCGVETWPTKSGFIWRIPRGREVAETSPHLPERSEGREMNKVQRTPPRPASRSLVIEYGIIEKPARAKKLFDKFLKENNLHLERMNSAILPQGLIIPSDVRITLCGDATGITKSWSGGGVIWGLMAANLLLKSFPDFLKYKKAVEKFFSAKTLFSKIATKIIYFLGFNFPWILPKNIKIESDFLI